MVNIDNTQLFEELIDSEMDNLKIYELKTSLAIQLACQAYETFIHFCEQPRFAIYLPKEFKMRNSVQVLHAGLDILVRSIQINCSEDGLEPDEDYDYDYLSVAIEAYQKALGQAAAEDLFKPFRKNFQICDSFIDDERVKNLRFKTSSSEISLYEKINEQLLQEQHNVNNYRLGLGFKAINRILSNFEFEDTAFFKSVLMTKLLFELPDSFEIGNYTLGQITEVWYKVLREAITFNYKNQIEISGMTESDFDLLSLCNLNWQNWNFEIVDKETTKSILDDLTFKIVKDQYTSLSNQPLLELPNGDKFISPKFILNYNHERNILSTLYRKYPNSSDEVKEEHFINDLCNLIIKYSNLDKSSDIELPNTNVDYLIYDKNTSTLVAFELKWLTEPSTSVEIDNKDIEIQKAIKKQLPNYKSGINENLNEFMLKAFNDVKEVKNQFYFVLTRGTIGSGKIERNDEYKVINFRMLKKALHDHNGNLFKAAESLKNEVYYPKEGVNFTPSFEISYMIGEIKVTCEAYKNLIDISYQTPMDGEDIFKGTGIDINKIPLPVKTVNIFDKKATSILGFGKSEYNKLNKVGNREQRRKNAKVGKIRPKRKKKRK